jgi:hypothetical protein
MQALEALKREDAVVRACHMLSDRELMPLALAKLAILLGTERMDIPRELSSEGTLNLLTSLVASPAEDEGIRGTSFLIVQITL